MSALEEIQAAIDKLTMQKDNSTPGAWARSAAELDQPGFMLSPRTCAGCGDDFPLEELDVELIATLHRTIDAQIALLSHTVEIRTPYVEQGLAANWDRAVERAGDLALARAINVVSS